MFAVMASDLTRHIRKLRKDKKLTQNEVADLLQIPRSTYAKKEAEGDFTTDDVSSLYKVLGGSKEKLTELARQNESIVIDDWKGYLIKNAIDDRAMNRVILMALAEILANQKGESVTKVLSELTKAVEAERVAHSIR